MIPKPSPRHRYYCDVSGRRYTSRRNPRALLTQIARSLPPGMMRHVRDYVIVYRINRWDGAVEPIGTLDEIRRHQWAMMQ